MTSAALLAVLTVAVLFNSFAECSSASDEEISVPQENPRRCLGPNSQQTVALLKQLKTLVLSLHTKVNRVEKCACKVPTRAYRDCADLYRAGIRRSGVYTINPDNRVKGAFKVYCDQTTAGGGWTVIQKRFDGAVDFYRGWHDYKIGFGKTSGEYWLGLDKINRLSHSGRYRLRVNLMDTKGNTRYASYDFFAVSSENTKYQLSLGTYSGTAGDSLTHQAGAPFSTKDRDNDKWGKSCAVSYHGAWWYKACHYSNLNGKYLLGPHKSYANGVNWYHWKGYHYSLKRTQMAIRPTVF